ncbi:IS21 family transposase [Nakamurella multipartita]|uniref:IstA2 n=1 Tax=Nakamurella multipartita (strain ATCC 700099 / DSM 44233 / CIP 104796 / JCM 9543 / NBRC 105858 / Y-104) TaxID=479431 RepID=C8XAX8_NAKMY|nr:IS21 family transposase [Nakamurella multipartita]ACV79381.1 IstA2 [Nakamurella multipartita DSM 44233]ACV81599.1 IstA2 [Nakamurella multipartita DSM 44233]
MGSRVELFAVIRRDARVEGLSIRELADRHHVHRRTVRQAMASALPPPRKTPVRVSRKLEPFKVTIDDWLRADLDAPRKQRHTAKRVLDRLLDEHGAADVSYSTVRDYVARRRPEIAAAAGRTLSQGFVPQTHEPGGEAEVDFADLWVVLRGVKTKTFLFTLRLSYSGKAVHRAFATQGQEAFLEGHVHAFTELGGTPIDKIRYDNLKAAVSRVLFGRGREESGRWVAFRSHFGFDAFYCHPGQEGAHEKGGVEGEGGRFRRNHCVPMPVVDSIEQLNELLVAADAKDNYRRIASRTNTVAQDWAFERDTLRPLPSEVFPTWLTLTPRVDRYARVTVRQRHYSVPARFIGRRVRVQLGASSVTAFDGRTVIATHERVMLKGGQSLVLDHYLEVLQRKPGALPNATALVQARASGMFTAAHEAFWAAARKAHGDSGGTRALIEVLLLHRHLAASDVIAGITAALTVGSVSPDVVAVQARKTAHQCSADAVIASPNTTPAGDRVVSLTERRLAELPADSRPLPSVSQYDELLTRESS